MNSWVCSCMVIGMNGRWINTEIESLNVELRYRWMETDSVDKIPCIMIDA